MQADWDALAARVRQEVEGFQKEYERERSAYATAEPPPTRAEWAAWAEAWRARSQALAEDFARRLDAFLARHGLGDCRASFELPSFAFSAESGPDAEEALTSRAPPEDDPYVAADREVQEVWSRCGTDDVEARRACEQEARALYERRYLESPPPTRMGDEFGSFQVYWDEAGGEIAAVGKHVRLRGNPDSQILSEVACGGQRILDRAYAHGFLEGFDFSDQGPGALLRISAGGRGVVDLHDNVRCVLNLATGPTIPAFTLDVADYFDASSVPGEGLRFSDGATDVRLRVHQGTWVLGEGHVVEVRGRATLLVVNAADPRADLGGPYQEAVARNYVAAEVRVAFEEGELRTDIVPMSDVDVRLERPGPDRLYAVVESREVSGKTLVLRLDRELFEGSRLGVKVNSQEGDWVQPEACVQRASDLADVLDPTDDGECHEYWVVSDRLGYQVLVSISHFSQKRIDVEADPRVFPVPGPHGLGFLLAGATAFLVLAWRRSSAP